MDSILSGIRLQGTASKAPSRYDNKEGFRDMSSVGLDKIANFSKLFAVRVISTSLFLILVNVIQS